MLNVSRITPIKTIGVAAGLMTLATLNSCSSKEAQKPMHNVEIRYMDKDSTKHEQVVKMEEGSSFENDSTKYVMYEGKLISMDKKTYQWNEDVPHLDMDEVEMELFKKVANQNIEVIDTPALTTKDIDLAQKSIPTRQVLKKTDAKGISQYYGYNFLPNGNGLDINVTNYFDLLKNVRIEHDATIFKD